MQKARQLKQATVLIVTATKLTIPNTKNRNLRFVLGYENDAFDIGIEHTDYTSDNEVRTGRENGTDFAMNMDLPEWNRKKTVVHAEYKKPISIISKIRVDAYRQKNI